MRRHFPSSSCTNPAPKPGNRKRESTSRYRRAGPVAGRARSVWPIDSVDRFRNSEWSQTSDRDQRLLERLGVSDRITRKPTRINFGLMKTSGFGQRGVLLPVSQSFWNRSSRNQPLCAATGPSHNEIDQGLTTAKMKAIRVESVAYPIYPHSEGFQANIVLAPKSVPREFEFASVRRETADQVPS
jgi:hypothetical protein